MNIDEAFDLASMFGIIKTKKISLIKKRWIQIGGVMAESVKYRIASLDDLKHTAQKVYMCISSPELVPSCELNCTEVELIVSTIKGYYMNQRPEFTMTKQTINELHDYFVQQVIE